ncbi:MAG: 2OG-Fe(II) oxygenase [Woeseiaceae bacterium]
MSFRLSSSLDGDDIRRKFEQQGIAHIESVLPDENARRIRKALLESTPWNTVFNDRDKHVDLTDATLQAMPADQAARLRDAIYAQASSGFQYLYNNYPVYDAWKSGINKDHVLHQFYEWINGEEFLGFARAVTGYDDISYVDAQATRYRPGHFLTSHDDSQEGKNRRAAYIFNFTTDWRADWGGYLQLLDEAGHVRRGIKPTFNALTVLAVPQQHNVSFVAPFAAGMRFAVSGWLRYGGAG